MAKYKLKALNVHIGGVLYSIEDKPVFDTSKSPMLKKEIESAAKAGFLVEVKGGSSAAEKAAAEKAAAEKAAAEKAGKK